MNWKPTALILLVLTVLSLAYSVAVFADSNYGLDTAAQKDVKGSIIKTSLGGSGSIPLIIGNILSYVLGLVGVIFFILILYSGLLWMTAGGAPEKLSKAQDILKAAAIGLMIVVGAFALTRFIFQGLTASNSGQSTCAEKHPRSGRCIDELQCPASNSTNNDFEVNMCPDPNQVCCFNKGD